MKKQNLYNKCIYCQTIFKVVKSTKIKRRYCSKKCYWKDKTNNNWMRGKYLDKHFRWMGSKATYNSIHKWVQNNFKKTGCCELCCKKIKTEWANIDHNYNRQNKKDWKELCRNCHTKFDKLIK